MGGFEYPGFDEIFSTVFSSFSALESVEFSTVFFTFGVSEFSTTDVAEAGSETGAEGATTDFADDTDKGVMFSTVWWGLAGLSGVAAP